jgi:hypothetical protein
LCDGVWFTFIADVVDQVSLLLRKIYRDLVELNFFLGNLLLEFAEILELFAGSKGLWLRIFQFLRLGLKTHVIICARLLIEVEFLHNTSQNVILL